MKGVEVGGGVGGGGGERDTERGVEGGGGSEGWREERERYRERKGCPYSAGINARNLFLFFFLKKKICLTSIQIKRD